jgi:HAD superfamily hydrolase (TIGR01493 family)
MQAVLFDWRGTLVHDPPIEWWVSQVVADPVQVEDVCRRLTAVLAEPDVLAGQAGCDCSRAAHDEWFALVCARAGLDRDLTAALDALDLDPANHPFYPDVAPVLRTLHDGGVRIAVVSDIHVDLRPEFATAGLAQYIDAFVLSFEHGVQKPDRAIFELALRAVGVEACDALMVGDRASHDGGAIGSGIPTLLLPPVASADEPVGLHRVLRFFT